MTTGFGVGDALGSGVMARAAVATGGVGGRTWRERHAINAVSPATISRDAAKNQ